MARANGAPAPPPPPPSAFDSAAVMRSAVGFANDSLNTMLCLQYEAHIIAGGCLLLAGKHRECAHLLPCATLEKVLACKLPENLVHDVVAQLVESYRQLGHIQLAEQLERGSAAQGHAYAAAHAPAHGHGQQAPQGGAAGPAGVEPPPREGGQKRPREDGDEGR